MADTSHQVNPPDPEVIRREMEETRASLAEKLEVLEKKVTDTVEEATEAVSETVESVKETVAGTVETVKETVESTVETVKENVQSTFESVYDTLNLSAQVERHPWLMVGGSVVVGFLGGYLASSSDRRSTGSSSAGRSEPASEPRYSAPAWTPSPEPEPRREPRREGPSWVSQLLSVFGSEVDKLKGMAIGTLGGVVRDLITEAVPENLRPKLTEIVNDLTSKLGGEKIEGRVLPESQCQREAHTGTHASSHS